MLVGCTGESHTMDRPTVTDCSTATSSGLQGDPCVLDVECGIDRGDALRSAVCDNGTLLTAVITEEPGTGDGPCEGTVVESAGVTVTYLPAERGCLDVQICLDDGGAVTRRDAHICQNGLAPGADFGTPWEDCIEAVRRGADGDMCFGTFACIVDRSIGAAGLIPILGWCDAGVLRLTPSQTLLLGPP